MAALDIQYSLLLVGVGASKLVWQSRRSEEAA